MTKTKCTVILVVTTSLCLIVFLYLNKSVQGSHGSKEPKKDVLHNTPTIHFSTDFEPKETTATYSSSTKDLTLNFLQPNFIPGVWTSKDVSMPIYYEGGTHADRYAEVSPDPTLDTNHVLHYWLKNAAIPAGYLSHYKGRIQNCFPFDEIGNMKESNGSPVEVTQIYMKQRIYLPPDWNLFLNYPANKDTWWLGAILQEFWMGTDWQPQYKNPARISVGIVPDMQAHTYHFGASFDIDKKLNTYWKSVPTDYQVPIGEWFTMELFYKMGNASDGRFVMRIQKHNETKPKKIIDVKGLKVGHHMEL